jgi:transcriptional regulator with XRE-family HTH domain
MTLYIQLHQIKKQLNYRKTHRPFETLPLGSAMKFRRKELHMTLEEAALDLTSVSYLSKLENNLIKPIMRFIKLFEERLKMKFDQHEYDHDYHDQIHHALLALHQDQMMDDSIYAQYKNKQNQQSYLFIFTHHILSNEYDKIKPYYESLKSYVPNLLDDEMTLFLTCVTKVLMKEERYLDAYER